MLRELQCSRPGFKAQGPGFFCKEAIQFRVKGLGLLVLLVIRLYIPTPRYSDSHSFLGGCYAVQGLRRRALDRLVRRQRRASRGGVWIVSAQKGLGI